LKGRKPKRRRRYVIAARGREGAEWFSEGRRLGLETENNPVDVGVRVEVPAVVADPGHGEGVGA
jgi:uncharacterized FAD-dependent dehydrogenase